MNRAPHYVVASLLIVIGLIMAGFLLTRWGSPRGWIDDNYRRVSYQQQTESAVYTAKQPPNDVLRRLTRRWEPYRRLNDSVGYFLRYRDSMVLVSARDNGGSTIRVKDNDDGYHAWGAYIGGAWGTYSGRGEGFRGGGPGSGK